VTLNKLKQTQDNNKWPNPILIFFDNKMRIPRGLTLIDIKKKMRIPSLPLKTKIYVFIVLELELGENTI
jgi:hypothetical protein